MRTIFRLLTLVLVGALPVLMHPVSARAAAILDQAQTETDGTWALIEDNYWPSQRGQIFTVGTYGFLTRISVYLENDSTNPATAPIMVSIQTMAGGLPSGQVVTRGIIYPENIPTSEGWVDVDLDDMFVAEGTQYAIILIMAPADRPGRVKWFGDFLQDLYAGGRTISNYEDGQGWRLGNGDFVFKTYVDPYALDQAQTAPWTDVWRIGGGYRPEMAQIVTASMYGTIYKVSLYLNNVSASGPVRVSIQTVIDGKPSGNEIGHGEIPADALPSYGSPDWVNAIISNNNAYLAAACVPGFQYAVVVSSEISTTGIGVIQWYTSGNVYPQGIMLTNEGSGWLTSFADAMLKTYVKPDELDQKNFPWTDCGFSIWPGSQFGQTFTAGKSGFLDRVIVELLQVDFWSHPVTTLNASIQTVTEEGYPSGIEIGHGSIPGSAIPYVYYGNVEIGISSTEPVIAGTQYAIVLAVAQGSFIWFLDSRQYYYYGGGQMMYNGGSGWTRNLSNCGEGDAYFATYVATPFASSPSRPPLTSSPPPSPPPPFTPCSDGICPAVTATVIPNDSTARITSNVQFRMRQNGTVHGILNFNDSRTGEIALRGCTTDSAACRLAVTSFSCTDENTITIKGHYTPKEEDEHYYELNLSGVKNEIGTFTLILGLPDGDQTYTFTRKGIVDVTCPLIDEGP
jgi:hypothetical protein